MEALVLIAFFVQKELSLRPCGTFVTYIFFGLALKYVLLLICTHVYLNADLPTSKTPKLQDVKNLPQKVLRFGS